MRYILVVFVASSCVALRANWNTPGTVAVAIGGNEAKRFETPPRDMDTPLDARIRSINAQQRGFVAELNSVKAFIAADSDRGISKTKTGNLPSTRTRDERGSLTRSIVSKYVIPLITAFGNSQSRRYLDFLKEDIDPPSTTIATAPIKSIKDEIFVAALQVGGQKFYALVDTGSSDTWLMMKGHNCIKASTLEEWVNKQAGIPSCQFGPSYEKSSTFSQIEDRHFNVTYADGDYATGILGKDDVTLGNITLKGQTLGFVNTLKWHGDGISSGLMGLGFPSITNAWNGTDPRKDKKGSNLQYAPIFTNLHRQKIIQPYFSIALNRASEGPGMLALGGLPGEPIRHTGNFVRTPMQQLALIANRPKPKSEDGFVDYTFYVVKADAFLADTVPLSTETGSLQLLVDSGSRFCHLPKKIVDGLMTQWKPKPRLNLIGQWEVGCDSSPPTFELAFNGSRISFDKKDLIIKLAGGVCTSTIANSIGGQSILGAPFFRSVVAVFDVGAAEMRFANRVR